MNATARTIIRRRCLKICLLWSLLVSSITPAVVAEAFDTIGFDQTKFASSLLRGANRRLGESALQELVQATKRALQFDDLEQPVGSTEEGENSLLNQVDGELPSEPQFTEGQSDWVNLNDLLLSAVFSLPDTDIEEMLAYQTFRLALKNMVCAHMGFEDIKITPDLRSEFKAGLEYNITNLRVNCEFDFSWKYVFLVGNGHARVNVGDSSAQGALDIFAPESQTFNDAPPQTGTFTACETDINILSIDFSGNIAAEILNLFETLIVDAVNGLLNQLICGGLTDGGDELLEGLLSFVSNATQPYLEPVESWRYNVTYPEDSMVIPENATVYSWNDNSTVGQFVTATMDEMESFLGALQYDEKAPENLKLPNGTEIPEGYDLGINVLLREYILDEYGTFIFNGSDLGDFENSSIIAGWHDQFVECNVSLVELKVYGLDTFTVMQPFQRIKNFTIQNALSWEYLTFEIVLAVDFLASSLEDSIIEDPERTEPYQEELRLTVGVDDVNTVISVMLALDPTAFYDLQLGSLVNTMSALPCVLASLHDVAVAGLNVSLGNIRMPTIQGMVSPGLDRLLKDGMDLGFFLYKPTVVKAIPAFFETTVKDFVTAALETTACTPYRLSPVDSFMDLRDLLLDEITAKAFGATGMSPYGDLTPALYGIGRGMWESVEEDGSLGLNSLFVGPLTKGYSGVEGRFMLDQILFNVTAEEKQAMVLRRFEFIGYNLTLDNLNTIVHPMAILQPGNHPYITQSTINMGPIEDAPIKASLTLQMSLDMEGTPLNMDNIVSLGISVSSVEVFAEILTMMSTNNFLNFRLGDLSNMGCVFGVITPPELNSLGYRVEERTDNGIEIRRLLAKISDLQLHIDCIKCVTGIDSLPGLVDIFYRTRVTEILSYRIPLLLEEIAISALMQKQLDRWIFDAPHHCPHRPEYTETYERPLSWEQPEFKQMSAEASDTIFFTPLVGLEVAFVLLVETHYPWELNTLDPLSGQDNFVQPDGTELFDFLNFTETYSNQTSSIQSYLSESRVDLKTGKEDLGINLLMRDWLSPDAEGKVDLVPFLGGEPLDFVIQGVVFLIHSLKVRGMDSFTRVEFFTPISPQTVLNSMQLRDLQIEINITAGSRTAPEQYVVLTWGVKDLNATVPLFAAFDTGMLSSMELGHFLNISDAISCFLASAVDIHFPQVLVTLGELSTPTFEGFLPDSGESLRQSMEEVFGRYGEKALTALPTFFDVTARTMVNTFIANNIGNNAKCTHIVERTAEKIPVGEKVYPYNGFVDFREMLLQEENSTALGGMGLSLYGDIVRTVITPLQDQFLAVNPKTGLSAVNGILGPLGGAISGEWGTITVPQFNKPEVPNFHLKFGALIASLTLGFGDVRIENIDTIGDPLALLEPIFMKPYSLQNSAGIGLGGRPFKFSARFLLEISSYKAGPGDELVVQNTTVNDVRIGLSMENAKAFVNVLTRIPEDKLIHFRMADIANPFCWASLFPAPKLNEYGVKMLEDEFSTFSFSDISVMVSNLNLTVECISCATAGINTLIETLSSPGAEESMTALANDALALVSTILEGNWVADQLDRLFDAFPRYCPTHPDFVAGAVFNVSDLLYKPLDFSTNVEVNSLVYLVSAVCFSFVLGAFVIASVVRWTVNKRHQKWLHKLPVQKILIMQHLQEADNQQERELNETTVAMIHAGEIPAWVRYAMPVFIVVNLLLFFSGHVSVAADVAMEFRIAGESIPFERFYSFSIITSTFDMWRSGAKELACFMLLFSGIWPYVKQLMSLACWVAPPSRLSISTRGTIYIWLDVLAKWSIVDIFVVLMYMISFRLDGTTPPVPFLPDDFFGLTFYIVPKWGIYANLIAQIISQVSSHYIIYYHRLIVQRATKDYEGRHLPPKKTKTDATTNETNSDEDHRPNFDSTDRNEKRGRLCDVSFARPHKGESSKLVLRHIASYGVVVGTVTLIVLILVGNTYPMQSIEVQGLMSFISGEHQFMMFSATDVVALLFNDGFKIGGFGNIAGHILLGITLVVTIMVVPVLQAMALAFQWFRPLDDKGRRRLATVIEILGAWQFAEVWILATVISAWQQGQTSEMVMAKQCRDFNELFTMAAYYGIIDKSLAHCFRVEAEILSGCYVLLAGTVLLAILNSLVGKATFHYFWDKECIRKEEAMEPHVPFEEEAAAVGEKTLTKIRPPPVLFTDTFRWLLRPEHLGDRPLKSVELPLQELVMGHPLEGMDLAVVNDNLSVSSESQSWPERCPDSAEGVNDIDQSRRTSLIIDC